MPYVNEYSKHKTVTDLVNNEKVRNFMSEMKIITRDKSNFEKIDQNIFVKVEDVEDFKKQDRLNFVFAFDGSKTEIQLQNGFPGAEIGILKINQTFIELDLMKKYEKEAFPHPKTYEEIFLSQSFELTIPGFNVCSEEYEEPKDFFRFALFTYLENNYNKFVDVLNEKTNVVFNHETFLDTYIKMLLKKPEDISCINPCEFCASNFHEMLSFDDFKVEDVENQTVRYSPVIECKCKHNKKKIFITDLLHFHEGYSQSGSNEGLYTQIMSFMEKLIFMNLIENLNSFFSKENGFEENLIFKNCAFILDGPLAIYNYASWFATAMLERLVELQEEDHLVVIGVEKTGHFMKHLEDLDAIEKEGDKPLEKGFVHFLEDKYIKRYIKYSTSPIVYGKNFYFGKKLYYKNYENQLFVINYVFTSKEDVFAFNARTDKNYEISQTRLADVIWIFERFASSRFKNALSFVSMAHENSSLSANYFSKRVIEDFVSNALSKD